MSLATIVRNGRGRAGHWRVIPARHPADGPECCALQHYSTTMAIWRRSDGRVLYLSTGWGSVSDQGGMNTLFKILGGWRPYYGGIVPVPDTPGPAFYYRRQGGARFEILDSRYQLVPCRSDGFGSERFEVIIGALAEAAS